jgi:hypothetical protein
MFLSGYGVYAYFLGGIDGLPPLPPEFCERGELRDLPVEPPENAIDGKLRLAFGNDCKELKMMIKLDLRRKGWGLAADQFDPEPDGRIKLTPFSAFIMGKRKGEDNIPEIHTVRCDEAYLTLDKPINNMAELGSRKIVEVELRTKPTAKDSQPITIKNNRASLNVDDDVTVLVFQKPLFYRESDSKIWTEGLVDLTDRQAGVHPTHITAVEMEIHLTKDKGPAKGPTKGPTKGPASAPAKSKQKKSDGPSGVDHLILFHEISMHLWVDSQSGLFGSGDEKPRKKSSATARPATPTEKAHLIINTDGPFTFYPTADRAIFDSPTGQHVEVLRANKEINTDTDGPNDQLECSKLELHFRRKDENSASDDATGNKEIETAYATAREGEFVTVDMVVDKLQAKGEKMTYHGPTATMGAKTVITGQPLQASKEGHRITALELTLVNPDKNGAGQRAFAKGPGRIDLFDKSKAGKPEHLRYPWSAVWNDTLTSVKDKQGDKVYDLLTLTGDAMFRDDDHKQELVGDRLQVWLEPTGPEDEKKDPGDTKEAIPGGGRQKPHKVDAFGNVALHSPDFNVTSAQHLVMHFKDGIPKDTQLPDAAPAQKGAAGTADAGNLHTLTLPPSAPTGKTAAPASQRGSPARTVSRSRTVGEQQPGLAQNRAAKADDTQPKNKEPMNLEAREITAHVTRMGSENFLREMKADGAVHVHQKGATPSDKGVDIKGDLLTLLHFVQGDILHVWGDSRKPAELHLGETILIGPTVMINQKDNTAQVDGVGAMHMPAKNTMDGTKPAKEGSRLIIHWNKDMIFDGRHADFHGGVEAFQDESSLRCQDLEVMLDRPVSFKEGQKGGQEARVEKMLCWLKVYVIEEKKDDRGRLVAYHRLEARQADVDNPTERTYASGPGRTWIFGPGNNDQDPAKPAAKPQKTASQDAKEFTLTRIDFTGSMTSNNKKDIRTTIFLENVEVYHCPAERPDVVFNPDRPPKGGFYLRGDQVTNYTKTFDKNRKAQFMEAKGKVMFRTQEFFGHATTVKFNELQDLVIFEGPRTNPARLYQFQGPGRPPREIQGTKILYNRRTGETKVEGSPHIGD